MVPRKVAKFAKFLAIIGPIIFGVLLILSITMFSVVRYQGHRPDMDYIFGQAGAGPGIAFLSFVLAAYLVLVGYVYGDARRRGMPAALWAWLVVLIPNMIDFIAYLILRRRTYAPCSNCGRGIETGVIYCPYCGHKIDLPPSPGH